MPWMDFSTTAGSGLDSGNFQWSRFITECTGSPVLRLAASTSSTWDASSMVGHSTDSKPHSLASAKRSATESFEGSMLQ